MPHAKKTLLTLTALTLMSCAQLIPPQTLQDNPLNIDNAAIQTGNGGTIEYTAPAFGDFVPQGAAPDEVEVSIVISKVTVNASCLTLPDTFTVTLKDMRVKVWDRQDTFALKATERGTTENPITGTVSARVLRPELAVYAYKLPAPRTIRLVFDRQLYNLVTSGGDNLARLTGVMEVSDARLLGCRVGALVDSNAVTLRKFN